MTKFYRYNLDGVHTGLVRRREPGEEGANLAYVGDREWVADFSLLREFIDPGDTDLFEVDETEARKVASEYGVELDAEPTRTTALGDRPGIDD